MHHINDTGDKYKTLLEKTENAISEISEAKIKTGVTVTMTWLIGLRWLLKRPSSWLIYGCRPKEKFYSVGLVHMYSLIVLSKSAILYFL